MVHCYSVRKFDIKMSQLDKWLTKSHTFFCLNCCNSSIDRETMKILYILRCYLRGRWSNIATYNVLGTICYGRLVKKLFFAIVCIVYITVFYEIIGHHMKVVIFFRLNTFAWSL